MPTRPSPPTLVLPRQAGLPKFMRIKLTLIERLQGMQADEALPSLAELQKEFGVAVGTVQRALRDLQQEGLVDVRHGSGIYATNRPRIRHVGICFGYDILEPRVGDYARLLLRGLGRAEAEQGAVRCRHYIAAGTGYYWSNKYDLLEQDVRARLVDGIIVIGVYTGELSDLAVPIVGLHAVPNVTARVLLDYRTLVRQGLLQLAQQGCRRVAYAGSHRLPTPSMADNTYALDLEHQGARDVFLAEAAALGLETHPDWVRGVQAKHEKGTQTTEANGAATFDAILASANGAPDGIVSTDDHRTLGLCQAIRRHGLQPGRDIHLASHANLGSTTLDGEPVCTLPFDPDDVARALLDTAAQLVAGEHTVLNTQYVQPKASSHVPH